MNVPISAYTYRSQKMVADFLELEFQVVWEVDVMGTELLSSAR